MEFKIGDHVMPETEFMDDRLMDQAPIGEIINIVYPYNGPHKGYLLHMARSGEVKFYFERELCLASLASMIIWNPSKGFPWLCKWALKNCQNIPEYQLNDYILDRLFENDYNGEFEKPVEKEMSLNK